MVDAISSLDKSRVLIDGSLYGVDIVIGEHVIIVAGHRGLEAGRELLGRAEAGPLLLVTRGLDLVGLVVTGRCDHLAVGGDGRLDGAVLPLAAAAVAVAAAPDAAAADAVGVLVAAASGGCLLLVVAA